MKKFKINKPEISSNYSKIPHSIWTNQKITTSQLKLLGFLLSQKDGFELNKYFISKILNKNRLKLNSDLNKLIEYGFITINNDELSFNIDILDGKIGTNRNKNNEEIGTNRNKKIGTNRNKNNEEIGTNRNKIEKYDQTLDTSENSIKKIGTNRNINNTIAPDILEDTSSIKEKEINKEKESGDESPVASRILDTPKKKFEKMENKPDQYPGDNLEDSPSREIRIYLEDNDEIFIGIPNDPDFDEFKEYIKKVPARYLIKLLNIIFDDNWYELVLKYGAINYCSINKRDFTEAQLKVNEIILKEYLIR